MILVKKDICKMILVKILVNDIEEHCTDPFVNSCKHLFQNPEHIARLLKPIFQNPEHNVRFLKPMFQNYEYSAQLLKPMFRNLNTVLGS